MLRASDTSVGALARVVVGGQPEWTSGPTDT